MKTTTIMLLVFLSLARTSNADSSQRPRIKSDAPSPVLTSILGLEATIDYGDVTLVATGLTASGKKATRTEILDGMIEEQHHLKYMTDPRDGYWTSCRRILLEQNGKTYVVGYEERDGDSDSDDTDESFSYGANIPFDFAIATQTFRIQTKDLTPFPVRFRQRNFAGVRFLVPINLRGLSKGEAESLIKGRGGMVADSDGPVDVVVLPDRVDFCPNSYRGRNRLAERWVRSGAKVLWERNFGRRNAPADCSEDGDWRD